MIEKQPVLPNFSIQNINIVRQWNSAVAESSSSMEAWIAAHSAKEPQKAEQQKGGLNKEELPEEMAFDFDEFTNHWVKCKGEDKGDGKHPD